MADSKRFAPYIWPTWISGLLSGEKQCEWAAWYRAHFNFEKADVDGGDIDRIRKEHDEMVQRRAAALALNGWTVKVEDDNKFKLEGRDRGDGKKSIMAGKPDIIAVKPKIVQVIDEKSGQKRKSDEWQVRIYQLALARTWFRGQGITITGIVEYRNDVVIVEALKPDQDAKIRSVMAMAGGDLEPPKTPSLAECRFCPIAACPSRMKGVEKVGDASDVF